MNTFLAKIHTHQRDIQIKFYEKGHKYEIMHDLNSTYMSVTTWVHTHFPKFDADLIIATMMKSKNWKPGHKYWGQTPLEIKTGWSNNASSVSEAGTNLHYKIECFMNNELIKQTDYLQKDLFNYYESSPELKKESNIEWQYFIQFIKDHPDLKPYRTEWMIYDEEHKIAGSIDMIYENLDGTLSIYDWKRSKEINTSTSFNKFALTECICHLPDTNFWHYSLQLNIYKTILEEKYNKVIKDLFLVRIHPNNEENTYELISVPILKQEMNDLFDLRKKMINKKT